MRLPCACSDIAAQANRCNVRTALARLMRAMNLAVICNIDTKWPSCISNSTYNAYNLMRDVAEAKMLCCSFKSFSCPKVAKFL